MRGVGIIVNPQRLYAPGANDGVVMADETPLCPPHRWRIEEPEGKDVSKAFCKKCGKDDKHYRNYLEHLDYIPSLMHHEE